MVVADSDQRLRGLHLSPSNSRECRSGLVYVEVASLAPKESDRGQSLSTCIKLVYEPDITEGYEMWICKVGLCGLIAFAVQKKRPV